MRWGWVVEGMGGVGGGGWWGNSSTTRAHATTMSGSCVSLARSWPNLPGGVRGDPRVQSARGATLPLLHLSIERASRAPLPCSSSCLDGRLVQMAEVRGSLPRLLSCVRKHGAGGLHLAQLNNVRVGRGRNPKLDEGQAGGSWSVDRTQTRFARSVFVRL